MTLGIALEELVGPALLLDAELRIVAASPAVKAILGMRPTLGMRAPDLLCGQAADRPVAEALAQGHPIVAALPRPLGPGRMAWLHVRATPLREGARLLGSLILLHAAEEPAVVVGNRGSNNAPTGGTATASQAGEGFGVSALETFAGMITADPGMKRLFHMIRKVARGAATVLVRGETGAGKELVARAIHDHSPRATGPFRALNCAALPAPLLESELFGHAKGAFTGAHADRVGHIQAADGGTLFLDEVAELPLELQPKLLRSLETRTVLPVGGREPVAVDVRVVAATHKSLREEVKAGRFRADLMYRLRVIPLYLPPLRERPGDAVALARAFLAEFNARGGRRVDHLSAGARQALGAWSWPGNVRELRNALEYAYAMGEGAVLLDVDLPPEIVAHAHGLEAPVATDGGTVARLPDLSGLDPEATLGTTTNPDQAAAIDRIRRALERANGHKGRAAAALGLSRVTLWRRMRELGMAGGQ